MSNQRPHWKGQQSRRFRYCSPSPLRSASKPASRDMILLSCRPPPFPTPKFCPPAAAAVPLDSPCKPCLLAWAVQPVLLRTAKGPTAALGLGPPLNRLAAVLDVPAGAELQDYDPEPSTGAGCILLHPACCVCVTAQQFIGGQMDVNFSKSLHKFTLVCVI